MPLDVIVGFSLHVAHSLSLWFLQLRLSHVNHGLLHLTYLFFAVLINLGLLLKFGQLSGLAQSQGWDDSGLQQLPSVPDSQEDIGGNVGRKADWIWEMVSE